MSKNEQLFQASDKIQICLSTLVIVWIEFIFQTKVMSNLYSCKKGLKKEVSFHLLLRLCSSMYKSTNIVDILASASNTRLFCYEYISISPVLWQQMLLLQPFSLAVNLYGLKLLKQRTEGDSSETVLFVHKTKLKLQSLPSNNSPKAVKIQNVCLKG